MLYICSVLWRYLPSIFSNAFVVYVGAFEHVFNHETPNDNDREKALILVPKVGIVYFLIKETRPVDLGL
jgi:hypothetical protein